VKIAIACRGESVSLEEFIQALGITGGAILLLEANDVDSDLTKRFFFVTLRSDLGLLNSLTRIRGRTQ